MYLLPYSLGIDLGTTFSAAAIARNNQVEILALGYRSPTIPSIIVARESGEILIGEAAERRSLLEPLRTAREFKRRLGDPTPILLGSAPYSAETLMSYLLRGIFDLVVEQQGDRPDSLVISHPANWGLYKLDLLEQAVRMAEVGQARYVTEPIAAALHYAGRERIEPGDIVAVYDFGGGTFDAALLRRTELSFEPLGEPEGIERLGGIDFDEAVFVHVMQSLADQVQDLDPSDSSAMSAVARLREECRQAKEALSVDTDVIIPVILPNIQTEVRLTRSEFEEMVGPRIGATVEALRRAARSAGMELSEADRILLVGGSSRIPLVRQRVREETNSEIYLDAHPKYGIALGAAIAADLDLGTTTAERMAAREARPVVLPPAAGEPESSEIPIPATPEEVADGESPGVESDERTIEPGAIAAIAITDALVDDAEMLDAPVERLEDESAIEDPVAPPLESEPAVGEDAPVGGDPPPRALPEIGSTAAPAAGIASSEWQDGVALSPVLIGSLVATAIVSAMVVFVLLMVILG